MKIANQGLLLYPDSFGIPRSLSVPLVSLFSQRIKDNGEEYTCSFLKNMKLSFIREKAGMSYIQPWVKLRNKTDYSGIFGALQRWCRLSFRRWSKVIKLLQIYTTLYSPRITPSQETKFLDGVNARDIEIPVDLKVGLVRSLHKVVQPRGKLPDPPSLVEMPTSPTRRAPHPNGKTYPEDEALLESMSYTRYTNHGWSYSARYARLIDCVERDVELIDNRDSPDICEYHGSVGRIGIIQEQGYKLRAVANPGRIYQCALQPLGKAIYDILPSLAWDCTHNQSKPFCFIQKTLSENKFVYSIDLSGATDYFPLSLQILILKEIFPYDLDSVNLFHDISRGVWQYGATKIRWSKGQPLGLYPSFGSFALVHGLLLFFLNEDRHNDDFFVLGDDVVILNSELYERYITLLSKIECPISHSKSLVSNTVAEFAGKLLTKHGVVEQTKWRNISDDSFLDNLRNIGPKAMRLLKPRQRKVAKILWDIPDFMGGLGFNPDGIPLEDRIFKGLCLFDGRETASYLMSFNKKINKLHYGVAPPLGRPSHFRVIGRDFDQKSRNYTSAILPILEEWYEISGRNLFEVNPNLDLPIEGLRSSLTRLESLERTLDLR